MLKMRKCSLFNLILLLSFLGLTACTTGHPIKSSSQDGPPSAKEIRHVDLNRISEPKPKKLKKSRYGNPPVYKVAGKRYRVLPSSHGYHAVGVASWYGSKFHHKRTSSGEPYDMFLMTAAHRTLPIPSIVRVTSLDTGRAIFVRVNDRGPFSKNRLIDLSYVAARKLGIYGQGTGRVKVETVDPKPAFAYHQLNQNTIPSQDNASNKTESLPYLQVGAFSNRQNAENLLARVKQLIDKPIRLKKETHIRQTIYRVVVGPFIRKANLSIIQEKLAALGIEATLHA